MSITLHPEKGVNPRLTICPRCGGDGPELMLIGNQDGVYKCKYCGKSGIGNPSGYPKEKCPSSGSLNGRHEWKFQRRLDDMERIPGSLCDNCIQEIKEHEKLVADGGVYWRCLKCGKSGVILAHSEFAKAVRNAHKLAEPDTEGKYKPCGAEFDESAPCPACTREIGAPDETPVPM